MTRWLVTGAGGMLAQDVLAALRDHDHVACDRSQLDITDRPAVLSVLQQHRPDVVVNCAGWTAVDAAEEHEAEAFDVNAVGPANLAGACRELGARLLHISTDYIFDGLSRVPYPEDAPARPRTAYGRTKAAGEWAVRAELPSAAWIVRTGWLYGAGGPNFVRTMIELERSRETVDVVYDQVGQPTWSGALAPLLIQLVTAGAPPGVYHGTASGSATWYEFARAVFDELGADPSRVRPTSTARFPRPAQRPAYSVLSHDGWRGIGVGPLPHWRASLRQAFDDLRKVS
jgi:dTDP-4-dehydrorhamnose reductase